MSLHHVISDTMCSTNGSGRGKGTSQKGGNGSSRIRHASGVSIYNPFARELTRRRHSRRASVKRETSYCRYAMVCSLVHEGMSGCRKGLIKHLRA